MEQAYFNVLVGLPQRTVDRHLQIRPIVVTYDDD